MLGVHVECSLCLLKTDEYQVQVETECSMKRECLGQQLCINERVFKQHSGANMFGYFHYVTWFRVAK